jgi:hypothetical protein
VRKTTETLQDQDDRRKSVGLELHPNDQEQNGEDRTVSTSELVQYRGQLQTTVVTLLISAKFRVEYVQHSMFPQ